MVEEYVSAAITENKRDAARKNWCETDCKQLLQTERSAIREAYKKGFDRACSLMTKKTEEPFFKSEEHLINWISAYYQAPGKMVDTETWVQNKLSWERFFDEMKIGESITI